MTQLYIIFSFLFYPVHDVNLAIFNLEIKEQSLEISIQFDVADLEYALSSEGSILIQDIDHIEKQLQTYLSDHTTWNINGSIKNIDIQQIQQEDDHYTVTLHPLFMNQDITEIQLYNTCLTKEIRAHKNIIHLHQRHKDLRGFQMDASRETIIIFVQ